MNFNRNISVTIKMCIYICNIPNVSVHIKQLSKENV